MTQQQTPRHKVFVSYHHDDQAYKDDFIRAMGGSFIDKSVDDGDIDDTNLATETIRQKIRDEFIADATVTLVLIGPCTWQRKHVDWEIGSSLRDTKNNPRCGLLGILLPNHPHSQTGRYDPRLTPRQIPPRLVDNSNMSENFNTSDFYAGVYPWPGLSPIGTGQIRHWIDLAYQRRNQNPPPHNSRPQFKHNRPGNCRAGWQD